MQENKSYFIMKKIKIKKIAGIFKKMSNVVLVHIVEIKALEVAICH